MKLDLHLHSRNSNDALNLEKTLVEVAKLKGIGFALTDHNSINGWNATKELARKENVPFIQGEEIMVFQNQRLVGEVIGLFMNEFVPPGNLFEVLEKLKKQDALITIPHPFDRMRKALFCNFKEFDLILKKVDAIEVFNSRMQLNRYNRKAQIFAEKHCLGKTAGSDGHTPEEIGNAFIECGTDSLEEARKLISKGKVSFHGKIAPITAHFMTQLAKRSWVKDR